MTLPSYLTSLLKLIAQAFFRVEFGVVPWEFPGYLTLGQSLLQKTLMKVQMPVENPRNFLGQFSLGTNDSQSHGGDSRARLHPSDAINQVPFWFIGSELHLSLLWSVPDCKAEGVTGTCCASSGHA